MRWLTRWLPAPRPATSRAISRGSLTLERLDRRDLPAMLFVVPGNVGVDNIRTFHDLSSALGGAAAADVIQIEPNSAPGVADGTNGTNTANIPLTIQGDPADGPTSLPWVGAIAIESSGVTLKNLNLGTVDVDDVGSNFTLTNSLVDQLAPLNSTTGGNTVLNGDTFTTSVQLTLGTGDQVTNNTFRQATLTLTTETNTLVQGNTFNLTADSATALSATDATGLTIQTNTFVLTGNTPTAIFIQSNVAANGTIAENAIDTAGSGTGISLQQSSGNLTFSIWGNDLSQNLLGVEANGDGTTGNTAFGTVDLGNGPLGSPGGNDFHGFTGNAGHFAIETDNDDVTTDTVTAQGNVFSSSPADGFVAADEGTIDVSNPQTAATGFIQTVYTNFLKRPGNVTELNTWTPLLATESQAQVVSTIMHSTEGESVLVAGLYQQILGRAEVGGEGTPWVNMLQHGATEEQVAAGILASPEFAARAFTISGANSISSNDNYIQGLYQELLGRSGSAADVDYWLGQLTALGRTGVAQAFMATPEFRGDLVQAMYYGAPNVRGVVPFAALVPDLLHRPSAPTPDDVSGWVNTKLDILSIESGVAGSVEAFMNG